jgi:hypothetical protein
VCRVVPQVHDAILDDLVYPTEIVGKRTRYRVDGSKVLKVSSQRAAPPATATRDQQLRCARRQTVGWAWQAVRRAARGVARKRGAAVAVMCSGW